MYLSCRAFIHKIAYVYLFTVSGKQLSTHRRSMKCIAVKIIISCPFRLCKIKFICTAQFQYDLTEILSEKISRKLAREKGAANEQIASINGDRTKSSNEPHRFVYILINTETGARPICTYRWGVRFMSAHSSGEFSFKRNS